MGWTVPTGMPSDAEYMGLAFGSMLWRSGGVYWWLDPKYGTRQSRSWRRAMESLAYIAIDRDFHEPVAVDP
jgi:hypothetical protein